MWPDGAVFGADQRVQPAVRLAAVAEIVDQIDVPALRKRTGGQQRVDVDRDVVVARQAAEEVLRDTRFRRPSKMSRRIGSVVWRTAIGVGWISVRNVARGSTGTGSR